MFEFPMFPEQVLRTEAALYGCEACPERCGGGPLPLPLPRDAADGYGY